MKTGIDLIAIERQEQIEKHNRTLDRDKRENNHYQLSEGAALLCYVDEEEVGGVAMEKGEGYDFSHCCPTIWDHDIWDKMMNKPYKERLIIAGALLAAEIDRLNSIEE
jgi:hypothetical protein